MLFKCILTIKFSIFIAKKPLHLNIVVQTPTSKKSTNLSNTFKEVFGGYIYMESRFIITSSFN